MWFYVDACGDVTQVNDPALALQGAKDALEEAAEDGSWDEGVTQIMWGKVIGSCEETSRRPVTDEDVNVPDDVDEIVTYEIKSP